MVTSGAYPRRREGRSI